MAYYKKPKPYTLDSFLAGNGLSVYRHTCPRCRQAIHLQTICESFGEPAKWIFWGKQGQRVKMCEGAIFDGHFFTHFAVKDNGRVTHRLAWEE